MHTRMLPIAAAMVAALSLAASAQQDSAAACSMAMHGMMMGTMGRGVMDGGMMRSRQDRDAGGMRGEMRGRMSDSSIMAHMGAELGLSDAQMQQMRAMHQRACAAAQPHINMAMQAHEAAMQALQGDHPSLDHFEDQLDKAAKHMVEAQVAMAKAVLDFRNSLTPAQRQKMDQMHQRMMKGEMH